MKYLLFLIPIFLICLWAGGRPLRCEFAMKVGIVDTLPTSDSLKVSSMLRKMTDTLSLSEQQVNDLTSLCYALDSCRLSLREQYSGQRDSLRWYLNLVERGRDSAFMNILSPAQYRVYGEKKQALIFNN